MPAGSPATAQLPRPVAEGRRTVVDTRHTIGALAPWTVTPLEEASQGLRVETADTVVVVLAVNVSANTPPVPVTTVTDDDAPTPGATATRTATPLTPVRVVVASTRPRMVTLVPLRTTVGVTNTMRLADAAYRVRGADCATAPDVVVTVRTMRCPPTKLAARHGSDTAQVWEEGAQVAVARSTPSTVRATVWGTSVRRASVPAVARMATAVPLTTAPFAGDAMTTVGAGLVTVTATPVLVAVTPRAVVILAASETGPPRAVASQANTAVHGFAAHGCDEVGVPSTTSTRAAGASLSRGSVDPVTVTVVSPTSSSPAEGEVIEMLGTGTWFTTDTGTDALVASEVTSAYSLAEREYEPSGTNVVSQRISAVHTLPTTTQAADVTGDVATPPTSSSTDVGTPAPSESPETATDTLAPDTVAPTDGEVIDTLGAGGTGFDTDTDTAPLDVSTTAAASIVAVSSTGPSGESALSQTREVVHTSPTPVPGHGAVATSAPSA